VLSEVLARWYGCQHRQPARAGVHAEGCAPPGTRAQSRVCAETRLGSPCYTLESACKRLFSTAKSEVKLAVPLVSLVESWLYGCTHSPLRPFRQLRRKGETVSSVARYLGVPRTTLAYALKKTEREIARTPETRGRPNALTNNQVLCGVLGYFRLYSRWCRVFQRCFRVCAALWGDYTVEQRVSTRFCIFLVAIGALNFE